MNNSHTNTSNAESGMVASMVILIIAVALVALTPVFIAIVNGATTFSAHFGNLAAQGTQVATQITGAIGH